MNLNEKMNEYNEAFSKMSEKNFVSYKDNTILNSDTNELSVTYL